MPSCEDPGWLAQGLRLTAFPQIPQQLGDVSGSWADLLGEMPESTETKPKEHTLQESGPFREGVLSFRFLPGRIDWIMSAAKQETGAWETIGTFVSEAQHFAELMKRWLSTAPEINRLAFGALVIDPVCDHAAGYASLGKYLSLKLDPESKNFLYQINRPRKSHIGLPGLEINRLSKWSCMARVSGHVLVGDTVVLSQEQPDPIRAVRLELDINTISGYQKILDRDIIQALFAELLELGVEIAEKGDIK